jgi:hypothetical protein
MNAVTRWQRRKKWAHEYLTMRKLGDEPLHRVKAHLENLDEFWLRWLGFCRQPTFDAKWLIDNDLFNVVVAVSEIAGEDVAKLDEAIADRLLLAWHEYEESLADLPKSPPEKMKSDAENSYLKFKAFVELFKSQ